ncbi:glycoside hydrolase family 13 protein [Polychaeton citri CBS 116435]|uniref:Glycoside hydrolase family 13 protein n=1 Tax=Polychaeton citri CBS 116435 TaxID=1314669 RepID=A0A9P4US51_9PEZI|nr:glycoside hydrolase family 13 protein [Polychaeton citri CBS 116435]
MALAKNYDKHAWWKEAVVYQIYPSTFLSTGKGSRPGWGDLAGITSKLDYLKHLGVDVVWASPINKSPQVDMGYDISDYLDIDPLYGTLSDLDDLIAGLKKRGMKLMMDLVVNHTSDQHAWFLDSRSSKDSKYRDWYIWKPAKYDEHGNRQPPNNWSMLLGEANSAWTWDEKTQEYYLALFTAEQPDLNWEDPKVREAVHEILKFWLDRGACGFRMDVINHISKVQTFPDAPIRNPGAKYQPGFEFFANGPRLHEYLREIHDKVLSKYDTITVGEMPFVKDDNEILKVVGADAGELRMIFIFAMVDVDNDTKTGFRMTLRDWEPKEIGQINTHWQRTMMEKDGWNSLFIENHDNPRSISRYCDDSDEWREHSAKLLALMQTTLSGTIYVYQGEELGMRNIPLSWDISEYKDIETVNYWKKMNDLYPGDKEKLDFAKRLCQKKSRDHARTPVQWTAEPNAGFCPPDVTPWMRVNDDYKTVNAETQRAFKSDDQLSVLQFWKRGLANRKEHKDVFVYGDYKQLAPDHLKVYAYRRWSKHEAFVTILNFSNSDVEYEVPAEAKVQSWAAGTYTAGKPDKATSGKIVLRPWEGILGESSCH